MATPSARDISLSALSGATWPIMGDAAIGALSGGAVAGMLAGMFGGATLCGPSWNQLWRQLAQRTCRPAGPMALSGTT
jgi:hypothetical protein